MQDIQNNRGCLLCGIHGDLIKTVTRHIPEHRKKDVIYLNIPDMGLKIGYNPLKRVSYEKRSLMVGGILESFQKLWPSSWGSRLEHILRYILLTLADQPRADFRDIVRIIHDSGYRKGCMQHIVNPDVRTFWAKEYPTYGAAQLSPLLNKVGAFLAHPKIKRLLVENRDSLSLRRAMDTNKIVLVNLSKGELGTDVTHVLGSLLLSSLSMAAFGRINVPEEKRVPFHIFLDEFQNYTNQSLVTMLSELRKFRISLTLGTSTLTSSCPISGPGYWAMWGRSSVSGWARTMPVICCHSTSRTFCH